MEVVEKSIEKPTSSDAEESNESATETPSVGGSGGKESSNSETSSAGGGQLIAPNGGALSGGRPNVKKAEDGSGAERRNGAATSEVRNAQWDMLRREAHGGIIQRDGLTDGHTGTEVPR